MPSPPSIRQAATRWVVLAIPATLLPAIGLALGSGPAPADPYQQEIRPTLQRYCYPCHGKDRPSGEISLSSFADRASVQKAPETWQKVVVQLSNLSMPPPGMPQPSPGQRKQIIAWVDQTLSKSPAAPDPGRILIHRLTRTEYNNTIRDLFGVDTHPADRFPADGGGGGGFDNDSDTLFLTPILMERYLQAATEILTLTRPEHLFLARPGPKLSEHDTARLIFHYYATRAYRRTASPADLNRLMRLFDRALQRGQPFEPAVKTALKALLISPRFLYRIERSRPVKGPYRVDDFDLASRLSYFLWSSMPDDELFHEAEKGHLHEPAVLDREVDRMLRDPKSRALADGFAGQWLRIRELYTTAQPDPVRFPSYTPALRDAMYSETVDCFSDILRRSGNLLDLLDADYTYLNQDLAKLYGIPGVQGRQLRRVRLTDHRRGGVLTMASVLTVTSYPERTSPVLRGKWVLEQLLGSVVPPPPPGAGGLPPDDSPQNGLTFRQRLEQHRSKPECASCHSRMDPLGFGLENFDTIGRWRDAIGGVKVDASGVLTTGQKFTGPVELKQYLLADKREFIHNLTEKMLAYALGRGLQSCDDSTVNKITEDVCKDGFKSATLIKEIVNSYPFGFRQDG